MRFGAKIVLVLICVGVLPIAILGWVSYRTNRDELQQTVGRMQAQAAGDLSLFSERFVLNAIENLRLAVGYLPFDELSRSELSSVLSIPYRQLRFVNVLAVVDDDRTPIAGPVFERHPESDPGLAGHEAVRDEDLAQFAAHIPTAPGGDGEVAVGPPYRSRAGAARLAVAIRIGKPGRRARVLAAELSLSEVERRLRELTHAGGTAYLVDGSGEPIASGDAHARLGTDERQLAGQAPLVATVLRGDGKRWLAGYAPLPRLGWGAVVAQPVEVAFRAADRLRAYMVVASGVTLVLIAVLSTILARGLTLPIQRLSHAVHALTAGSYDAEIDVPAKPGTDELSDLGHAFGTMTSEIRRRDEEIRRWNSELQTRVEDRTAELKSAQDQIIRTRRLAALGSLGAGLSHELNNPMTAIMGYVSILRKQLGEHTAHGEMLGLALEQAQRVTRIVEDLRRFADQERAGNGKRFSLEGPVHAAIELYADRLRAGRIQLSTRFQAPLPEVQGDPVQIQQVVAHLLDNAINAMPVGGALDVSVSTVGGEALKLCVADTGKGIPPAIQERIFDPFFTTKEHPARVGLGLSVSHSIVEAHHGKIIVESELGAGAAFTVLLPVAAAAAHLA